MSDINRLKKLSGILVESAQLEEGPESRIKALFQGLLNDLEREYPHDENMKGLVYHYRESLENEMNDSGYESDSEESYYDSDQYAKDLWD